MRSKSKVEVFADDTYEQVSNFSDDDNDAAIAEMQAQSLAKSLDQLTPDEQSILLMKYQDDFSIRDIAKMLDVTESAVKMRLKRAKDKLRRRYVEGIALWVILITKALSALKWPFGS